MEGHSARFAGRSNMPQSPPRRKVIVTSFFNEEDA